MTPVHVGSLPQWWQRWKWMTISLFYLCYLNGGMWAGDGGKGRVTPHFQKWGQNGFILPLVTFLGKNLVTVSCRFNMKPKMYITRYEAKNACQMTFFPCQFWKLASLDFRVVSHLRSISNLSCPSLHFPSSTCRSTPTPLFEVINATNSS